MEAALLAVGVVAVFGGGYAVRGFVHRELLKAGAEYVKVKADVLAEVTKLEADVAAGKADVSAFIAKVKSLL